MFRYLFLLSFLLGGPILPVASVVRAQSTDASVAADSLAALQQAVVNADSSGDAIRAINARLAVEPLLSRTKALRSLLEAELLVDSTDVKPALAAQVHQRLVDVYTGMGEMTKANREWALVVKANSAAAEQELAATLEAERARAATAQTQLRDSLAGVLHAIGHAHAERARTMKAQQDLWMYIAIGCGAFAVMVLVTLCVIFFGSQRRMRRDLKELKQEVTWLRMVNRKRIEEERDAVAPVAATAPSVPAPPLPAPAPVTVAAEDEELFELVKRRGVERLRTLQEARQRGDREKVVRVVHSMKPQLVALDAVRYSELCARLVAPSVDESTWSADLDRFEANVKGLIEGQR